MISPIPRPTLVRTKICGITNLEDAEAAIAAGADALGFNTWPGTKRFIDLEKASEWISTLPPFVAKVALLVNAPLQEAERVARLPFIDLLQLHGDEDSGYCKQLAGLGRPFIKALRVREKIDFSQLGEFATRNFLIDAFVAGSFGGTGELADFQIAREFGERQPDLSLILAGGLNPENVGEAIRAVRPYAVDVSSGVEKTPGQKDAARMEAFIRAVQGASESV